jgi:phosphopantothenoylcysteine decarboxylase/phosphopantothenate--cysteine ligase
MHTEMWEHPAVRDNIATLKRRGVRFVEPGVGRLAGGDLGAGRLADPADIVQATVRLLSSYGSMTGIRAVVTAGGTREPIDPVRYIGNRSSGRQGYAIAGELAARGASVSLVSTVASSLDAPAGVEVVEVETALEMLLAVESRLGSTGDGSEARIALRGAADLLVMTAAVADFRPAKSADQKIKRADGIPIVELVANPDILARVGTARSGRDRIVASTSGQESAEVAEGVREFDPVLVGFAAETVRPGGPSLQELAVAKLEAKGADLIVANDVALPSVGFGHATNAVVIVGRDGHSVEVPLTTKELVATAVVDAAQRVLGARRRLAQRVPSDEPTWSRDTSSPNIGPGALADKNSHKITFETKEL